MEDISGKDIEIKIKDDGKVVWVNTPEGCILRACDINSLMMIDERQKNMLEKLAKRMAGEIVLSERPWEELRKWRLYFKVSQNKLAGKMGITSSVISDYESGRRKSPGVNLLKRIIIALTGYKPIEVRND